MCLAHSWCLLCKHLKQHVDIVTNMWLENTLSKEHAKEALVYLEHIEKCVNTMRRALNALFEEEKE
jgi:hypothetical protein